MADNPYVNKVEYDGQTLMDLTGDTVTPSDVLSGVSFHDRSGAAQQGSLITHNVYDGLDSSSTSDALSANQGRVLNNKLTITSKSIATGVTLRSMAGVNTLTFTGASVTDERQYGNLNIYPSENTWTVMTDTAAKVPIRVGLYTSGKIYLRAIDTGNAVSSATLNGELVYIA